MNFNLSLQDPSMYALIDELSVYVRQLHQTPDDAPLTALFMMRLARFAQMLRSHGFGELWEIANELHGSFDRMYGSSVHTDQELIIAGRAFVAIARDALRPSEKKDDKAVPQSLIAGPHEASSGDLPRADAAAGTTDHI